MLQACGIRIVLVKLPVSPWSYVTSTIYLEVDPLKNSGGAGYGWGLRGMRGLCCLFIS